MRNWKLPCQHLIEVGLLYLCLASVASVALDPNPDCSWLRTGLPADNFRGGLKYWWEAGNDAAWLFSDTNFPVTPFNKGYIYLDSIKSGGKPTQILASLSDVVEAICVDFFYATTGPSVEPIRFYLWDGTRYLLMHEVIPVAQVGSWGKTTFSCCLPDTQKSRKLGIEATSHDDAIVAIDFIDIRHANMTCGNNTRLICYPTPPTMTPPEETTIAIYDRDTTETLNTLSAASGVVMDCAAVSQGELVTSWMHPESLLGNTKYDLRLEEALSWAGPESEIFVEIATRKRYSKTELRWTNLRDYWPYAVYIRANTSEGNVDEVLGATCWTNPAAPGPVTDVNVNLYSGDPNKATIQWGCPLLEDHHGEIEEYVIMISPVRALDTDEPVTSVEELVISLQVDRGNISNCLNAFHVDADDLVPQVEYLVKIWAKVKGVDEYGEVTSKYFNLTDPDPRCSAHSEGLPANNFNYGFGYWLEKLDHGADSSWMTSAGNYPVEPLEGNYIFLNENSSNGQPRAVEAYLGNAKAICVEVFYATSGPSDEPIKLNLREESQYFLMHEIIPDQDYGSWRSSNFSCCLPHVNSGDRKISLEATSRPGATIAIDRIMLVHSDMDCGDNSELLCYPTPSTKRA